MERHSRPLQPKTMRQLPASNGGRQPSPHLCSTYHLCTSSFSSPLHQFFFIISASALYVSLCTSSFSSPLHQFFFIISASVLFHHLCISSLCVPLHQFFFITSASVLFHHLCISSFSSSLHQLSMCPSAPVLFHHLCISIPCIISASFFYHLCISLPSFISALVLFIISASVLFYHLSTSPPYIISVSAFRAPYLHRSFLLYLCTNSTNTISSPVHHPAPSTDSFYPHNACATPPCNESTTSLSMLQTSVFSRYMLLISEPSLTSISFTGYSSFINVLFLHQSSPHLFIIICSLILHLITVHLYLPYANIRYNTKRATKILYVVK